jgi:hypothetical protein
MSEENSIVDVRESHNQAEGAIRELQKSGLDTKKPMTKIVRVDSMHSPLTEEGDLKCSAPSSL